MFLTDDPMEMIPHMVRGFIYQKRKNNDHVMRGRARRGRNVAYARVPPMRLSVSRKRLNQHPSKNPTAPRNLTRKARTSYGVKKVTGAVSGGRDGADQGIRSKRSDPTILRMGIPGESHFARSQELRSSNILHLQKCAPPDKCFLRDHVAQKITTSAIISPRVAKLVPTYSEIPKNCSEKDRVRGDGADPSFTKKTHWRPRQCNVEPARAILPPDIISEIR